jgi:protoheme ferro-lyase
LKHIVLVTYGEPTSAAFVEQLVYSWRILLGLTRSVADIPAPLIPLIALSRARGRNALWRRHAYSSPLEPITHAQAAQLSDALMHQSEETCKIQVAYEFREPRLADVLARLPRHEQVVVVPMYAADSAFTHELSRQTIKSLDTSRPAPIVVLPAIDVEQLAAISADHVLRSSGSGAPLSASALVLAAHGTLLEPARPIETGRIATERLCDGIARRLAKSFGMVANGWLNHTRGGRWTEPPIEETLRRVSDAGYRDVVYYPYGFLADNAESQLEGQLAAAGRPELRVRFVPCLNDSFELAEAIAQQVIAAR